MTAYELIADRLAQVTGFRPPNEKAAWRCPAHVDSTASLSVGQGNKGVVLHCHAGCETEAVLAALELTKAQLFDEPLERRANDPIDTYRYVDEGSNLLFEVVRYPGKNFRQRRPLPGGGWDWKLGDVRRVPYRLPQVVDGVSGEQTVFVVEGEKDVHAIERAGGVATCNPGGAGKWRAEYSEFLRGADVVIVADQDIPGAQHAAKVEASLVGKAKRIRMVDPLAGKDATDHLAGGHTLEEWLATPAPNALKRSLLGGLVASGVPQPSMVHPWLYAGGLHSLQAEPGVGKSWIAVWLCLVLIQEGWAVMYMDEEGGDELVAERLIALGADPEAVDRLFHYYPFPQREWNQADVQALRDELASIDAPVAVGILDSLPDFLAVAEKDEDRSMQVTSFVHTLLAPFRDVGAALLVLDHLVKPDDSAVKKKRSRYARGSGAKLGKAHLTLLLETVTEFDRFRSGRLALWKTKDRRGFVDLPGLTHDPLYIDVHVDAGSLRIEAGVTTERDDQGVPWEGPTHCMEAIEDLLRRWPGTKFSITKLQDTLRTENKGFRKQTVGSAAAALMGEGRCYHDLGPRSSERFWWEEDLSSGAQLSIDSEPLEEEF